MPHPKCKHEMLHCGFCDLDVTKHIQDLERSHTYAEALLARAFKRIQGGHEPGIQNDITEFLKNNGWFEENLGGKT